MGFRLRAPLAAVLLMLPGVSVASAVGDGNTFVRISPRDARYFELSDGRPYIPIGLNMCWPPWPCNKMGAMEDWIKNLAANHGNHPAVNAVIHRAVGVRVLQRDVLILQSSELLDQHGCSPQKGPAWKGPTE